MDLCRKVEIKTIWLYTNRTKVSKKKILRFGETKYVPATGAK